ncbi:MAG: flagellar hook-basal body complex protein FliE [Candidatus Thiodiazotropha sp. (ex Rostrolucina anterorostrata)]|nr:flagellar hook-basal body complex protein FliE [Candidatus Thiodiazotropha sp. (ex Rostrolucina anterorostrata)]
MSVETVSFIKPLEAIEFGSGLEAVGTKGTGDFASWFDHQLSELNEQIKTSEVDLRKLATGETNNIHHVMLSLEKAKLSFQLMMQVRNKALEAYQDVMRMQV